MNQTTTRDRIVAEASRLFYEQGFDHTSFASIADDVGISRGNFYHHFKSKDDILAAVIASRLNETRATLAGWETQAIDPKIRIRLFIEILLTNQAPIMRHGCPVGTLCTELSKLGHPLESEARALFELFQDWLRRQFRAAGHGREAEALAMHVLAFSQGVAVMAQAFRDPRFVQREVRAMTAWLDNLATPA